MSDPFLSEIRLFSFAYAPKGWAMAAGQQLPINQNQALYSLLGTTYGGNGQTTFALPDLRGRAPMHVGKGHTLGERSGAPTVTLAMSELPTHSHALNAVNSTPSANDPSNALLGAAPIYASPANLAAMSPGSITVTGGSEPHENMQPFLTLNFCIALQGSFPAQDPTLN